MPDASVANTLNGSQGNPQDLIIHGFHDLTTCQDVKITITYFDSGGDQIGPPVGPTTPTINGGLWQLQLNAPGNAAKCRIQVFCGTNLQQTVEDVGF